MAQHATIHGKTTVETNGQSGVWIPTQVNTNGQLVIAPLNGELSQFNRLAGGAIVKHSAVIAADAAVFSAPVIFYGVKVVTAGTSITVYDNTAASGTAVITAEATATAGAIIYPAGPGVGVLMNNGLYLDLTLGTYIILYADQV
jgi:hypothetical protein